MTDTSQHCIMVVNQSATTGTDITQALERANYRVAGPFKQCSDASDWLTGDTADGALLDMLLSDDTCLELARDLRTRGVPYLFHSTTTRWKGGSDVEGHVPPLNALLQAMSELIRNGPNGAAE
jgi:DNA-binding NtrC family response regulator